MTLIVPASNTMRSGCSGTLTVQVCVSPVASVSEMVVVPEPTAVISPFSLTVATFASEVVN